MEKGFWKSFSAVYLQKIVLHIVLVTDTIFLSLSSSDVLAGAGVAVPVVYTLVAIIGALNTAVIGVMGQSLGAQKKEEVSEVFVIASTMGVLFGGVLAVIQIALSWVVPALMGFSLQAKIACQQYLVYMAPMVVTDGIFIVASSVVLLHGYVRKLFIASILLAATNIGLNWAVAAGLVPLVQLNARSVAIVTVISQFPALAVLLRCIHKDIGLISVHPRKFKENFRNVIAGGRIFNQLSRIFFPSLLNPISANLTSIALSSYLSRFGTDILAAFVFSRNLLIPVSTSASIAYSNVVQVAVSKMQGRGEYDDAKTFLLRKVFVYLFISLFGLSLLGISTPSIAKLLGEDEHMISIGQGMIIYLIFAETFKGLWLIVNPSLRGSGYVMWPVLSVLAADICILAGGYLLTMQLGGDVGNLLLLITMTNLALAVVLIAQWMKGGWAQRAAARAVS
jgi:Na+-driven multidrug efflux pump